MIKKAFSFLPLAFAFATLILVLPAYAETVTVNRGDTLQTIAKANNVPVKTLAKLNGLAPGSKLTPGATLILPTSPTDRQALLPPDSSAHDIVSQKPDQGVKEMPAVSKPGNSGNSDPVGLKPELRPAVDTITPSSSVAREPKTFDRGSPGLSATIHTSSNTEILGVFNLPGNPTGSVRPYGQPELGAKPAPSGGVMFKRTF